MATATAEKDSPPQVKVWLGNRAPIELIDDDDALAEMSAKDIERLGVPRVRRKIPVKKAATFVRLAEGTSLFDGVRQIAALWPSMSDAAAPAWVASTDPRYAELLAEHYRSTGAEVEVREPENPDEMHGPYKVDGGK